MPIVCIFNRIPRIVIHTLIGLFYHAAHACHIIYVERQPGHCMQDDINRCASWHYVPWARMHHKNTKNASHSHRMFSHNRNVNLQWWFGEHSRRVYAIAICHWCGRLCGCGGHATRFAIPQTHLPKNWKKKTNLHVHSIYSLVLWIWRAVCEYVCEFVAVCAMCMCWCFFRSIAFRIHYLCLMARCTTCFTLFIFFSVGLFISLLSVWIIHLICDSNISLHLCLGEKNKERTKMSFANNNAFCTSVDQRKTQARQTGGRHTFRSNLILLILWLRIWFVAVAGLNCS